MDTRIGGWVRPGLCGVFGAGGRRPTAPPRRRKGGENSGQHRKQNSGSGGWRVRREWRLPVRGRGLWGWTRPCATVVRRGGAPGTPQPPAWPRTVQDTTVFDPRRAVSVPGGGLSTPRRRGATPTRQHTQQRHHCFCKPRERPRNGDKGTMQRGAKAAVVAWAAARARQPDYRCRCDP